MPDPARIDEVREPYIRASILTPKEYVGAVMELCQERRGDARRACTTCRAERVQLTYDLPLAEIVLDFFDQLKSRTRGYASLDYELIGMRPSDLVKLDVLLAGDPVDALSMVVHRDKAYEAGRVARRALRKKIPRQQYDVPIQAAIGAKIIARETVKAFRKDVTAKCYGGDIIAQAQAAREAEGGQEADEAGRPHRGPAGGVPGRARARRRLGAVSVGGAGWADPRRRIAPGTIADPQRVAAPLAAPGDPRLGSPAAAAAVDGLPTDVGGGRGRAR